MSDIPETAAQELPIQPQKEKKVRKPRSVPMKILMGFLAFILCMVMFVVSVAGILILDVRAIVSRGGISEIINQLISGPSVSAPVRPALATGVGGGVAFASETSAESGMDGMLVDWAYDLIKNQFGEGMTITREQTQTFVEQSTFKDFVADKAAGLAQDFYSGKGETTITKDEIVQLIAENKEVIQSQFGVTIDQTTLDSIDTVLEETAILEPIEEQGLLEYFMQTMNGTSEDTETTGEESQNPMEMVNQIMQIVRTATSYTTLAILGGVFVLLMVLLFFVTGRSIPAMLADTGVVLLLSGGIFAVPTALFMYQQQMVSQLIGAEAAGIGALILRVAAKVNFAIPAVGFALIVAAIVVKIVKNAKQKKQA